MFRFKHRHIPFNGTMPLDLDVKQKLIDSTFFKRLEKPFISRDQYEIKSTNQLYTKGSKIVDPILGYDLILAASETVWGQKRKSPGFQRVLLELMQNTLEHAGVDSDDNEFWWLSVNHDKNQKKVSFVFVDYGQGIFESLASNKPIGHKWFDAIGKVKSAFGEITNAEMLKKLLDGEIHKTVTGKAFRGKGIPGINEVMGRNQISSLRLISNDASGDVKNDIFISLNNKFRGTFLYWELCYSNASHIWNLQK
jgi:uncharacterized protein YjbJ (UPF0337 family)